MGIVKTVMSVLGKSQEKHDSFCVGDLRVGDTAVFQTQNSRYAFGVVSKQDGYLTVTLEKVESRTGDERFMGPMEMMIFDYARIQRGQSTTFFFPSGMGLAVSTVEWLKVNGVLKF